MCVCGRSRVPLPASGITTFIASPLCRSWCAGPFPSVAILEPNDVVEMRRGRLEHVTVGHRFHLMDGVRHDPKRLPDLQPDVLRPVVLPHAVDQLPGE